MTQLLWLDSLMDLYPDGLNQETCDMFTEMYLSKNRNTRAMLPAFSIYY